MSESKLTLKHSLIILGLCIVVSVTVYAFANRYEATSHFGIVIDKWTGDLIVVKNKKTR